MTTNEELHRLIDAMTDERADRALQLLSLVASENAKPMRRTVLPRSLGFGASGTSDRAERAREILAEGFGH